MPCRPHHALSACRRVYTCARSAADLEALLAHCAAQGWDVQGQAADVSKAEDRQRLVAAASAAFDGVLHTLFNNVGTNIRKKTEDFTQVRGAGRCALCHLLFRSICMRHRTRSPSSLPPGCPADRTPRPTPPHPTPPLAAGGLELPDRRQPGERVCHEPAVLPAAQGGRGWSRDLQQQCGGGPHRHGQRQSVWANQGGRALASRVGDGAALQLGMVAAAAGSGSTRWSTWRAGAGLHRPTPPAGCRRRRHSTKWRAT